MNEEVEFVTMTDHEKYLYDLQGFLVVKGFMTDAEVKAANDSLDANEDKSTEFGPPHQTGRGAKGKVGIKSQLPGSAELAEAVVRAVSSTSGVSQVNPLLQHHVGQRLAVRPLRRRELRNHWL